MNFRKENTILIQINRKNKKNGVYLKCGENMKKDMLKRIIKYGVLFCLLIALTQFVYTWGKDSYNNYIDSHENDLEWVEKNIVLEDNYNIGSGVKVVTMPENLNVSLSDYTNIMNKKIKSLLVNRYSIEEPLLIYNPYKEDENSLYVYFHTGEKYYAEYYVTTESIVMKKLDELPYQKFLDNTNHRMLTTNHYYKIDSLVPKKKNNIIIRIVDEDGNVVGAENFILNIPSIRK